MDSVASQNCMLSEYLLLVTARGKKRLVGFLKCLATHYGKQEVILFWG